MAHIPVLLNQVLDFLKPENGDTVLDATVNGGGHSLKILKYILPDGKLVGIDRDKKAIDGLNSKFKIQSSKFLSNIFLIHGNFKDLKELLKKENIAFANAVLFDLGISSNQLEDSGRGFSFKRREPLLMTLGWPIGPGDLTAYEILNSWPKEDIFQILSEYGEERYAKKISDEIFRSRKKDSIETTFDLVEIIERSVPDGYKRRKIHFATKTFQALRIAVNDELAVLKLGLESAWESLFPDGRMVVISFHSLEDRIVKNFFKNIAKNKKGKILTKKPVIPESIERKKNPRSRSAKLRSIIKF